MVMLLKLNLSFVSILDNLFKFNIDNKSNKIFQNRWNTYQNYTAYNKKLKRLWSNIANVSNN